MNDLPPKDSPSRVASLVATKPDAVLAQEIRDQFTPRLAEFCALMDQARAKGFTVEFNIAVDPSGRSFIQRLELIRKY